LQSTVNSPTCEKTAVFNPFLDQQILYIAIISSLQIREENGSTILETYLLRCCFKYHSCIRAEKIVPKDTCFSCLITKAGTKLGSQNSNLRSQKLTNIWPFLYKLLKFYISCKCLLNPSSALGNLKMKFLSFNRLDLNAHNSVIIYLFWMWLCGQVVKVLGYRSSDPGSNPSSYTFKHSPCCLPASSEAYF